MTGLTDEDLAKITDKLEAIKGVDSVGVYFTVNIDTIASRSASQDIHKAEQEIIDEFYDDSNTFDFSIFYKD